MSPSPLSSACSTMEECNRKLAADIERSRAGWRDEARRAVDRRYCDKIVSQSESALRCLTNAGADLQRALNMLGE